MNPEPTPGPAPARWLFVAAARAIQSYVLRSDALKEMVGASELVEQLPKQLFDELAAKCGITLALEDHLTDAAGGIRALIADKAAARRLARLWPVAAARYAPGLETAVALVPVNGQLAEAIAQAEHQLTWNRQQPLPAVPPAPPLVARNRRTGLPGAYLYEPLHLEKNPALEVIDSEARRKRLYARRTSKTHSAHAASVVDKVTPPDFAKDFKGEHNQGRWPTDLNKLADERNHLAVLHADTNQLGSTIAEALKMLPADPDLAARLYREFSRALTQATERAAQAAMGPVLRQTGQFGPGKEVPLRPLVCAGEDFTAVLHPAIAVPFTRAYLLALERTSREEFNRLKNDQVLGTAARALHLPDHLTTAAGLVFCKRNHPFSDAYALAEQLCALAKQKTKRKASALAFFRIKSALVAEGNAAAVLDAAFLTRTADSRLTLNPYHLGGDRASGLAGLDALLDLARLLRDQPFPRGPLREIVTRAYDGKAAADETFARFRHVQQDLDAEEEGAGKKLWPEFTQKLQLLTGSDSLWTAGSPPATPLYDALELRDWLPPEDKPDQPPPDPRKSSREFWSWFEPDLPATPTSAPAAPAS